MNSMSTPKQSLGPLPALIFSSRWLQLPLYLGLIVAQGVYVVQFLRELWHLRSELFRQVALQHSQFEAEQRLSRLNRHFPTRAPRSGFAPLNP